MMSVIYLPAFKDYTGEKNKDLNRSFMKKDIRPAKKNIKKSVNFIQSSRKCKLKPKWEKNLMSIHSRMEKEIVVYIHKQNTKQQLERMNQNYRKQNA